MKDITRVSPVSLKGTPKKTANRNNWEIVLEYAGEGKGTVLVDLSHVSRFDLQSSAITDMSPLGAAIPEKPGQSVLTGGVLVNRMNGTQASVFCLDGQDGAALASESCCTDVSECTLCVAIIGKEVFSICEKLTALDFMNPDDTAPFLLQGPVCHVPCQVVTLSKNGEDAGIILTCSQGYGRDMVHAIMEAGEEFDLKPAGEKAFKDWIGKVL